MQIKISSITKDFEDLALIKKINIEAFPPNERLNIDELIEMSKAESIDIFAIYDDQLLIGFFVAFNYANTVHIFFIAIASQYQSKGYGSATISLIKQIYKNKQVTLAIEELDKEAPNYLQRVKRSEFYLRNGFISTDHYVDYAGISFEILIINTNFDKQALFNLLNSKKQLISQWIDMPFDGEIYKK